MILGCGGLPAVATPVCFNCIIWQAGKDFLWAVSCCGRPENPQQLVENLPVNIARQGVLRHCDMASLLVYTSRTLQMKRTIKFKK